MHIRNSIKSLLSVILLFESSLFAGDTPSSRPSSDTVIATVNGSEIVYREIVVSDDAARTNFQSLHGREPHTDDDSRELAALIQQRETKKLYERIRGTIRFEESQKRGIDVSRDQALEEINRSKQQFGTDEGSKLQALLDAVRSVQDHGDSPDAAYEKFLKGKMSQEEWQKQLALNSNPTQRHHLETVAAHWDDPVSDQQIDVMRSFMRSQLLDEAVDKELALRDPEFAKCQELLRPGTKEGANSLENMHEAIGYLLKSRQAFWDNIYHSAKIEVRDERFRNSLRELLPTVQ
jgi:hypothetical protein